MKRYIIGAMIALGFLLVYGLAGTADIEQQKAERQQYCDMIELWAETGGNAGWPPYKGNCED